VVSFKSPTDPPQYPECCANPRLLCRGTTSSNPFPSGESSVRTSARFEPLDATKEESLAALGVGKFDVPELRVALAIAGQGARAASFAIRFYTICRNAPSSTRYCRGAERHGVAVTACSPFGHGDFQGPAPRAGASYFRNSSGSFDLDQSLRSRAALGSTHVSAHRGSLHTG
jgi:aryl-alcohol dehydrogenase-like predicted oxidoreductase